MGVRFYPNMILEVILEGSWQILGVCSNRGECAVTNFLNGLSEKYDGSVDGMVALLQHVAERGPLRGEGKAHGIADKIFQYTKGQLRIPFFYGEGKQIVISHGFLKRGKKTGKKDKRIAARAYEDYRAALTAGSLEIVQNLEDADEGI